MFALPPPRFLHVKFDLGMIVAELHSHPAVEASSQQIKRLLLNISVHKRLSYIHKIISTVDEIFHSNDVNTMLLAEGEKHVL